MDPTPRARHLQDRLVRGLSLGDATMLVVSSVIGSGLFLAPGPVAELVPHPGMFLAAWIVGGALSLAGALANAELGAMYPHAGGDYVYLREAYHPVAGFMVGWLSFFVIYAGTVATLAVAFGAGLAQALGLSQHATVVTAVAVTVLTTGLNYVGLRIAAVVNNVTAAAKIGVLLVFAVAAPMVGRGHVAHLRPLVAGWTSVPLGGFGLALSPVLFTYLGWNAPVYVASELRRPERDLPWSLFLGLAVCTAIYLLVNLVYLYALPIGQMAHDVNVGESAARALLGPTAGALVAIFVLVSILGTLHATILVGPRIAYAMALDRLFFAGAERVHEVFRTPHRALVVQAVTAILLVVTLQRFPRVLDYTTFAIVLATMADTAALYTLRRRRPAQARPYRAWGYPVVPAVYLVANAGIAVVMCWGRPLECAAGLGVTAAGLPLYWLLARRRDAVRSPSE